MPESSASAVPPCTGGTTPALFATVTCALPGNYTVTVPTGTTSVVMDAVGAGGGAGYPARQHIGGNAGEVAGTATLPTGTAYLYIMVGAAGTGDNHGVSSGGGASAVMAEDNTHAFLAKLAIGGGGGGGAYNGDGGDAGSAGTSDNAQTTSGPGGPGVGATGGAGGTGNYAVGTAGGNDNPGTLTVASGGGGGAVPGGAHGGQGGGGYGGGGGGGASSGMILFTNVAGGGGGSSLASSSLASASVSVKTGTGGIQLPGLVAGDGVSGSVSLTFDGVAVPGAPTGVSAVAGSGRATVSFTAPTSDGGSPITGYTVTASPGGLTTTCLVSPCVVNGLTNGTAYTFTVHATNANGNSLESAASAAVTPALVPGAPTGVSAVRGNAQATVSFTAPTSDGGSPITGYTATSSPGGLTASCTTSPCVVTGLTNGTAYTFTVHASNAIGDSVESAPSAAVIAATVPGVPTGVSATPGNGHATVSFTAPADDGGSAVTSYTVVSSPGGLTATCAISPCVVTGLTNGTAYTFTVRATNTVGDSADSAPTTAVTPASVPGSPTTVVATAGAGQASVSFTAPLGNGGSAITGYTVTSSPGGLTATCTTSPCVITGLTNGTAYTFTVHATNAIGNSPESSASTAVTPLSVPGAPTSVSAVPGDGHATVTFTPPAGNGGSAITSYTVISSPGGLTATCATSPCVVTGLTNGTAYTFTVRATNVVGNSAASAPSSPVVPANVPGMPTAVVAIAGAGQASVAFSPPSDDGGSPITGYTITSSPGGVTATCTTSPCVITGLTNGTAYTFTVYATNPVGSSAESAASAAVTPVAVPGAPTAVTATAGAGQAAVAFTAPVDDGGSPITGYLVTAAPGGLTATCATSPCTVTGLTNGASYTFTVQAINAVGDSAASTPTAAVTPATLPGAPTAVSATEGSGQADVSFTAPADDGGSPVTGYTVTAQPGGLMATCPSTPCAVAGLTNGVAYTFTVTATNAVGTSAASDPSSAVTPVGVPAAPTVTTTAGNGEVSVSFPAPDDEGSPVTGYEISTDGGLTWATLIATDTSGILSGSVTGLVNGTTYSVEVRAINAVGTGAESAAVVVTPATVPGTPSGVTATAHAGEAVVSFTAPTSTGGSAITSYTVTSYPDGITATCTASPCVITGLTDGTSYTFTVHADNAAGHSPESGASAAVTPHAPPARIVDIGATATQTAITVVFAAPNDGGSSITGYQISTDGGRTWRAIAVTNSGSSLSGTAAGLAPGTSYPVELRAVTADGFGTASAAVSVQTLPAPIAAPTAVGGTASVTISWAKSPSAVVTGYTVYAHPGSAACTTASRDATSCVIGGTAGVSYTFTVVAHSPAGDSPGSAQSSAAVPSSASVPATAPMGAPTTLTTTDGILTTVAPAQQITFLGTGFLPLSSVSMILYSSPVVLATATTDARGDFRTQVTLPATIEAGVHNLVASGVDPSGSVKFLRMPVTVAAIAAPSTSVTLTTISATGTTTAASTQTGSNTTTPPAAGQSGGTTGSLSYTGVPAVQLLWWAFLLTGSGVVLARKGRRRSPRHR